MIHIKVLELPFEKELKLDKAEDPRPKVLQPERYIDSSPSKYIH